MQEGLTQTVQRTNSRIQVHTFLVQLEVDTEAVYIQFDERRSGDPNDDTDFSATKRQCV